MVGVTLGLMGVVLLLAFVAESSTEYFFGDLFDHIEVLKPYKPLKYVAAIVGLIFAFWWKLDVIYLSTAILSELLNENLNNFPIALTNVSTLGIIVTGVSIGRGSDYVHQLYNRIKKPEDVG